jgi:hypothetical protein
MIYGGKLAQHVSVTFPSTSWQPYTMRVNILDGAPMQYNNQESIYGARHLVTTTFVQA